MKDRAQRPARDDGFALLVVIVTTAVLALIVAGFMLTVRTEVGSARLTVATAQAEALADAGANLVALRLLEARANPTMERRIPLDGTPLTCAIDGQGPLLVLVQDEAGKIDLNLASERLLQSVLRGVGVEAGQAAALADALIDFRDVDDHRRPNGAEAEEYRIAGRPAGPKNAPLMRVDELEQVIGFDGPLLSRLAPLVTVHSALAGVDPTVSPAAVVEALSAGAARLGSAQGASFQLPAVGHPVIPAEFAVRSPQRVFQIRVEARTHSGVFVRESVIELPPARSAAPIITREWRRGRALSAPTAGTRAPADLGRC